MFLRRDIPANRVAAALGSCALALAAGCAAPTVEEEPGVDLAVRERFDELVAEETAEELEPVLGPELPPAPDAEEIARFERVLWRAGRPWVAGLPAVRASERQAGTTRALDALRERLEGAPHWRARCEQILADADASNDELWCALARASGRMLSFEWAPAIAHALPQTAASGDGEAERAATNPRRAQAARDALHDLFGRWFRTRTELEPFLADVVPTPGALLLLHEGRRLEGVARERLFALLRHEPLTAIDWIADPDPVVRAGAAAIVGDALARPEADRARLVARLFERLDLEIDARAHAALLGALVVPLQSETPDAPDVQRLRRMLIDDREPQRALSVARGLALVPWGVDGPRGEGHLLSGVAALGGQLTALADAAHPDADALLEALFSLETLCDRARSAGLGPELRDSRAREPIFRLMRDSSQADVVRVSAGESLDSFVRSHDWPVVIEVLRRGDASPALGHSLLAVLREILVAFEPDSPSAVEVLGEVAKLAAVDDPDLRRRALDLLADAALQPLVARMPVAFLSERLVREDVPDLSRRVIQLMRRFGDPSMLEVCLASERFDALASDPATIVGLTDMCIVLASGRRSATMNAAVRLAGRRADEIGLTRMRQALRLVVALDVDEAESLPAIAHHEICAWGWRLHMAGVDLATLDTEGTVLARIRDVHWQRSALDHARGDFDQAARMHLLAVVFAHDATLVHSGAVGDRQPSAAAGDAEQAFQRALLAASGPDARPGFALRVQRDRARFRDSIGESVHALADYRELVERDALDVPDLRRTIELLALVGGSSGRRVIAPEAFRLRQRLVARPAWRKEPASVRLQDLRDLCESALRSGDATNTEAFLALLADLPPRPPAQGADATAAPAPELEVAQGDADSAPSAASDPDALWSGLTAAPSDLTLLHDLVARARASLRTPAPETASKQASAPHAPERGASPREPSHALDSGAGSPGS